MLPEKEDRTAPSTLRPPSEAKRLIRGLRRRTSSFRFRAEIGRHSLADKLAICAKSGLPSRRDQRGGSPAAQSAAVPVTSSRGIALKLRVTLHDAKETRDRALTIRAVE